MMVSNIEGKVFLVFEENVSEDFLLRLKKNSYTENVSYLGEFGLGYPNLLEANGWPKIFMAEAQEDKDDYMCVYFHWDTKCAYGYLYYWTTNNVPPYYSRNAGFSSATKRKSENAKFAILAKFEVSGDPYYEKYFVLSLQFRGSCYPAIYMLVSHLFSEEKVYL